MIKFPNIQEYTDWYMKNALKFDKNDMDFVKIENIDKTLCICGAPTKMEEIAVRSAEFFISEWNERLLDELEEDELRLDADKDSDFISDLTGIFLNSLEKYLNMEIVYVSTEY